eukprot:scaffold122171_cov18-Tisochrysis_lutea.AAC.1
MVPWAKFVRWRLPHALVWGSCNTEASRRHPPKKMHNSVILKEYPLAILHPFQLPKDVSNKDEAMASR